MLVSACWLVGLSVGAIPAAAARHDPNVADTVVVVSDSSSRSTNATYATARGAVTGVSQTSNVIRYTDSSTDSLFRMIIISATINVPTGGGGDSRFTGRVLNNAKYRVPVWGGSVAAGSTGKWYGVLVPGISTVAVSASMFNDYRAVAYRMNNWNTEGQACDSGAIPTGADTTWIEIDCGAQLAYFDSMAHVSSASSFSWALSIVGDRDYWATSPQDNSGNLYSLTFGVGYFLIYSTDTTAGADYTLEVDLAKYQVRKLGETSWKKVSGPSLPIQMMLDGTQLVRLLVNLPSDLGLEGISLSMIADSVWGDQDTLAGHYTYWPQRVAEVVTYGEDGAYDGITTIKLDTVAQGSKPIPLLWRGLTGQEDTLITVNDSAGSERQWTSYITAASLGAVSYLEAFDPPACHWLDMVLYGTRPGARVKGTLFITPRRK